MLCKKAQNIFRDQQRKWRGATEMGWSKKSRDSSETFLPSMLYIRCWTRDIQYNLTSFIQMAIVWGLLWTTAERFCSRFVHGKPFMGAATILSSKIEQKLKHQKMRAKRWEDCCLLLNLWWLEHSLLSVLVPKMEVENHFFALLKIFY